MSPVRAEHIEHDSETGTQPIDRWDEYLSLMAKENHRLLSEILLGSCAKICGNTVLIYVRESEAKKRFNIPPFRKRILQSLEKHLDI